MKEILRALPLIFPFVLIGCGSGDPEIADFKKGAVVAWAPLDDDNPAHSSEQNCEKAFANQNGLIIVYQNNEKNFNTTLLWGGKTDQSKKDSNPMRIDPVTGFKVAASIQSSKLEGNKLVQEITRPDGAKQRHSYSQNKADKNRLTHEGWTFINPNESQTNQYENIKRLGGLKPQKLSYCSSKSFNSYVTPKKIDSSDRDIKINNALEYVLDKKWSLGDMNCNLNGGAYQVYSRSFPMGYAFYAGGKPQISDNPQEFQFIEKSVSEFTHTSKVGANNFVRSQLRSGNVITAEVTTDIKLVNPKKIEYKKSIRMINFDAMMNGRLQYDNKNETGFGYLCE
jgi:hypothetical protein